MIYVVEGALVVRHDGRDVRMEPGDSAFFDASEVHSYRGELPGGARAIVATTAGKPA